MAYELWDTETANLVGDYPTEEAALADVRTSLVALGPSAVKALALAFEDAEGAPRPQRSGAALIARAQAAVRHSAA